MRYRWRMIKQKKVTKIIHLRRHNNLDFCSFSGLKLRLKKTDYIAIVGSVFWLPIRQIKFLGTIEFLVSILDLNIQICRPFLPWKISHISLWIPRVKNHHLCLWFTISHFHCWSHLAVNWSSKDMPVKRWHIAYVERINRTLKLNILHLFY